MNLIVVIYDFFGLVAPEKYYKNEKIIEIDNNDEWLLKKFLDTRKITSPVAITVLLLGIIINHLPETIVIKQGYIELVGLIGCISIFITFYTTFIETLYANYLIKKMEAHPE